MTPTREQVIEWLIAAGFPNMICENLAEQDHQRMAAFSALAYSAGRLNGLGEAVEAVLSKVSHPDDPNNSVWSAAYDCVANECAAAIDQLKDQK